MMFRGLCIIPEGKKNSEYDSLCSEFYNVSKIVDLESYVDYAKSHNLGLLYLSIKYGVVYSDDLVKSSGVMLYQFNTCQLKFWSKVSAELIYRECLNHMVSCVHLMIKHLTYYKFLIHEMEIRGIKVYTPLLYK